MVEVRIPEIDPRPTCSTSDAERRERANDPHAYLVQALRKISGLRDSETAEPFDDALDIADAALSAYVAPPPPAAVQEPVAVKADEPMTWRNMSTAPKDGKHCILAVKEGAFIYSVQGAFHAGQWNAVHRDNVEPLCWMPNVRLPTNFSALSTSQSDPAPEIAALRAENERLRKAITEVRAEFHTDYLGEKLAGVSYGSTALARVVGLLDAAVAHEQEEEGE